MRIIGAAGIKQVGSRSQFTPGAGWSTVYSFVCDSIADAQAFAASQSAVGATVSYDVSGPPYKVEVTTAQPEGSTDPNTDYSDRWEITPIDADLGYRDHPRFAQLDGGPGIAQTLQEAIIAYEKGPDGAESDYFSTYQAVSGSADALSFLELLRHGTDHYQNFATSIRWTRTVSDGFTLGFGIWDSVSKRWTSGQIASLGAPTLYVDAMSGAESAVQLPSTGYATGWLKKQPSIVQRGSRRSDIVQEWVLANWSTFLYPAW